MREEKLFEKTIVEVEILSRKEDGPICEENFEALSSILADCSVKIMIKSVVELNTHQLIQKCKSHDSDPEFFGVRRP